MPQLPTIAVVCVRSAFVHVCSPCHAQVRIAISGSMTTATSSSCRPGVRVAFMLMGSAAALGKQAPVRFYVRGPICDTPSSGFFAFKGFIRERFDCGGRLLLTDAVSLGCGYLGGLLPKPPKGRKVSRPLDSFPPSARHSTLASYITLSPPSGPKP